MNKTSPPEASLLWQVIHAGHGLETRLEAELAVAGLSVAKAGLLRSLAQAGGSLTLSELADRNQCVRSNITQLVDRLEGDGLVTRVHDAKDRRVRLAELTAAGRTAAAEAVRITGAMERKVAEAVSHADATDLSQVLARLAP